MQLIDKEKLKKQILEEYPQAYYPTHYIKLVDRASVIEERRKSHWEFIMYMTQTSICYGQNFYECDYCKYLSSNKSEYCPRCGAKMENSNETD